MNPLPGLTLAPGGLVRPVAAPAYGRQDVGHAPGGAADRFAHWSGNALLDQDRHAAAVEAVLAPRLTFTDPAACVLTGAPRSRAALTPADADPAQARPVPHATVFAAQPGDTLTLGPAARGLRTYLCLRPGPPPPALRGRARPPFDTVCTTADPAGALRVTPGPEFACLADPAAFLGPRWRLSPTMSDAGVRLEPALSAGGGPAPAARPPEITSAPVADGVVQLTPAGPLVLLRQRPTLGGYPRIAAVVDVDIDRLAQHAPGTAVRFRTVTPGDALRLQRQREADLHALYALHRRGS